MDTSLNPDAPYRTVPCDLCGTTATSEVLREECSTIVRCDRCGLLYWNPQPSERTLRDFYSSESQNDYTPRLQAWYGELTREKEQQLQEELALLERHLFSGAPILPSNRPLRYLEVGCAFGHQLFCARKRGWHVIGVDYSRPAVNWIKERLGIDAIHGTVEEAAESVPANSIDIVLMSHVLEHVTRPTETISAVASLLRPGGILAIYVPNGGGLQARHDFSKREWIRTSHCSNNRNRLFPPALQ